MPTPTETPSKPAELSWFVPELQLRPLGTQHCLVRNPMSGVTLELSSGEYTVLAACAGCEPLVVHEQCVAERLRAPPEHRPAIRELLERCARAGLLMALPDLVTRFGAKSALAPPVLAGIVIRTADRPQLLARLLASAAALEARSGSRRQWIVVDDSRERDNERANRAAIDACRALAVEHIDRATGGALEQELRAEFPGFSREIAWLLGTGSPEEATYGRPVNHALLRLAGRAFVTVDDDVVLEPRRPAISEAGFAVSDEPDELTWYESEEALWRDCPPFVLDPIAAHEQWLGLPMAAAWARARQHAGELAAIRMPAAAVARFDAAARVLFTHNHACGDPGSSLLPLQLLSLPECSRLWLAANPQASAYAFSRRINWRGQARLRLAPRRLLTFTTMAGIDNSRLLPPAMRSHRSEDVLLGIAAQWMYPASWVIDLPFALPHLRAPAKRWLASTDAFMQEPLHVVYAHLDEHAPRIVAESAEERLAAMGALLLDLAAASDQVLAEMLLQHAADAGSRTLFSIQAQLDSATVPAAWKAVLAPWLRSPALAVDADALRRRVLEPGAVRALLEVYGSAMRAWRQLWEYCRERHR
ncbi:MAG: hypothetical protein M3R31_00790 [Pseudomonadota bacterium]|nr:hypothetical protein [Pseudomonadota bacterium]